jgi:DNA-binding MarR family transcriptional regulator
MTRTIWQWVREQIYAGVVTAGYTDLNRAHVALFRFPTVDGARPTALADQLQITKQSVNDLLGDLERRGYLAREADSTDGRARVVRLTSKGRELEAVVYSQAQAAERRIAAMLGAHRFTQFRAALEELAGRVGDSSAPAGGTTTD